VLAGKELEDARSCADYNIKDGAMIHLVLKVKGGGSDNLDNLPPTKIRTKEATEL
jgi:hypothetical protein